MTLIVDQVLTVAVSLSSVKTVLAQELWKTGCLGDVYMPPRNAPLFLREARGMGSQLLKRFCTLTPKLDNNTKIPQVLCKNY